MIFDLIIGFRHNQQNIVNFQRSLARPVTVSSRLHSFSHCYAERIGISIGVYEGFQVPCTRELSAWPFDGWGILTEFI